MSRWAIAAVVSLCVALPAFGDDQSPKERKRDYLPTVADLMIATQLRHFKLWYAGQVGAWTLAQYELSRVRDSFDEATNLHPDIPAANMTSMKPPADELGAAIAARDGQRFARAFAKLTAECNNCHQSAGFGFIVIKEPRLSPIQTSPFSDQAFTPR